jgi:hypothetical protein
MNADDTSAKLGCSGTNHKSPPKIASQVHRLPNYRVVLLPGARIRRANGYYVLPQYILFEMVHQLAELHV